MLSDTQRNYEWDGADRTTLLTFAGNSNWISYGYDGLGRRVKGISTVGGVTTETRYLWCGSRLCQTRDGQDNVTTRVYGEGEYQTAGAKKYVYLTDQLGSVRDVVDASTGSLVGSLDYRPYGQVRRKSGSVTPLYQYAMLPWDGNAGLSVSPTRFYDASVGRWMSRDPIREAGGINLYSYVGGSPLSLIDPTGLNSETGTPDAVEVLWGAAVVVGSGIGYVWNNTVVPYIFPTNSSPAPNSTPSSTPSPTASPTTGTVGQQKSCPPKAFSKEKQQLVDMAKKDKHTGMTADDMEVYKELNKQLPDPFPDNMVRGPETHPGRGPSSQQPHGHVGPVNHIPIK